MIYSVFNSNRLLIWRCNLDIYKASLILRLPTLHLRIKVALLIAKLYLQINSMLELNTEYIIN